MIIKIRTKENGKTFNIDLDLLLNKPVNVLRKIICLMNGSEMLPTLVHEKKVLKGDILLNEYNLNNESTIVAIFTDKGVVYQHKIEIPDEKINKSGISNNKVETARTNLQSQNVHSSSPGQNAYNNQSMQNVRTNPSMPNVNNNQPNQNFTYNSPTQSPYSNQHMPSPYSNQPMPNVYNNSPVQNSYSNQPMPNVYNTSAQKINGNRTMSNQNSFPQAPNTVGSSSHGNYQQFNNPNGPCSHGFYRPVYIPKQQNLNNAEMLFPNELKTLESMGFKNREENKKLLCRYAGDINRVLDEFNARK